MRLGSQHGRLGSFAWAKSSHDMLQQNINPVGPQPNHVHQETRLTIQSPPLTEHPFTLSACSTAAAESTECEPHCIQVCPTARISTLLLLSRHPRLPQCLLPAAAYLPAPPVRRAWMMRPPPETQNSTAQHTAHALVTEPLAEGAPKCNTHSPHRTGTGKTGASMADLAG
jgi:hypothetical protein